MDSSADYILILWDRDFDEVEAIIFISALRSAGLRTKVVGLGGVGQAGHLGVAIIPDLMLGQALDLLRMTKCIVVPCHPKHWARLADDPRYRTLMTQAVQRGITVVMQESEAIERRAPWGRSPPPESALLAYQNESVTEFAVSLADQLAAHELDVNGPHTPRVSVLST